MPSYLVQTSYTNEALAGLIKKPQDRTGAIRKTAEKLGGSVVGQWGSFGEYGIVVIIDMPDNVSATAMMSAIRAGGALERTKITPLFSTDEGLAALKKAGNSGYKPPSKK